jgi:ectoine hydroxylase-related dioxygenase (phytanoyl-CoA dioxygenase family)
MEIERITNPKNVLSTFNEYGAVLLKNVISDPLIIKLQQRVHELVSTRHQRFIGSQRDWYRGPVDSERIDNMLVELYSIWPKHESFIYDVLHFIPETYNVATCESLLSPIRQCLSVAPSQLMDVINVNFRIDMPTENWSETLPWHQEYPYPNPLYLKDHSIACWVAVFDCPTELGPVAMKLKSHKWGELEPIEISRGVDRKLLYTVPEKYLEERSDCIDIQPEINSGDVLIIDMKTIHRSGINTSSNGIRWSIQAHYHDAFAENYLSQYLP